MIPVETAWWRVALDLLERWQTLIAGLIALGAAWLTLRGGNRLERRREHREADAILGSLAVEVRETLGVVTRLHEVLKRAFVNKTQVDPVSLKLFTRLPKPTVYEASADKIGQPVFDPILGAQYSGLVRAGPALVAHDRRRLRHLFGAHPARGAGAAAAISGTMGSDGAGSGAGVGVGATGAAASMSAFAACWALLTGLPITFPANGGLTG